MTRTDTRTVIVAAVTGAGLFFVGAGLWPTASLEWFLVAMLATVVVIGCGANGWKEFVGSAVVECAFYGALYLLWRIAAAWFTG